MTGQILFLVIRLRCIHSKPKILNLVKAVFCEVWFKYWERRQRRKRGAYRNPFMAQGERETSPEMVIRTNYSHTGLLFTSPAHGHINSTTLGRLPATKH